MSCQRIKMPDGSVVLANMKPGAKLTEADEQAIAEWVQFCRDRSAKKGLAGKDAPNRVAKSVDTSGKTEV